MFIRTFRYIHTFLGGSDGKESACNVADLGSIPGLGRSPEEGHGNSLQCSCLKNPHGQRNLAGTVHGIARRWAQLSYKAQQHTYFSQIRTIKDCLVWKHTADKTQELSGKLLKVETAFHICTQIASFVIHSLI